MLESLRRSIMTEEELFQALACTDYASYHARMLLLVAQKRLSPVASSGLNGRIPPLYRKYRIVHPKDERPDVTQEIKALHPSLSIELYLAKPAMYIAHQDLLQPICAALWKQPEWWRARMSLNEKSFALYGDEKRMARERMRLEGVLAFNRLDWSLFRTYETPEPFFSWNLPGEASERKTPHVILVLENKDIWYSLTDLAESLNVQTLFPERVSCLIYGEGNKVSRERGSLTSYLGRMFGGADACQAYYCGDLDAEGVRIWIRLRQANPGLQLVLFPPIYREMIRWATERAVDGTYHLPPSVDERETTRLSEEEWVAFLMEACNAEGPESADGQADSFRALARALAAGGRIPQEAVNRTVLEHMAVPAAEEAPCP